MTIFDVKSPVTLKEMRHGNIVLVSMPEGSQIGFDGELVFVKNTYGNWMATLTHRSFLAKWLDDKLIKKQSNDKTQKTPEEKKPDTEAHALTPSEQEALAAAYGIL